MGQAPLLSLIVPVYGVRDCLAECLDSILAEHADGVGSAIEVVAVDDASVDGSGEVLDAYAARDHRVRVVRLPENRGLGLARNAGLAQAGGEYVWFVDSDDWLPVGSISAVVDRLRQTRPDVLLLDHHRVAPGLPGVPDASSPILSGLPGVFNIEEQPRLLRLQHTAWNKVIRRRFLLDLGLCFYPGWYEDVPFSNPLLISAEKIAVLDRVCYCYRLARAGSITSTPNRRHFEMFDQYERLWAWVSRHPVPAWASRELFNAMINHYLVVLGNEDRVPSSARKEFFRRANEHYHRYAPVDGAARSGGLGDFKRGLIRTGNFSAYALVRWGYRMAKGRAR